MNSILVASFIFLISLLLLTSCAKIPAVGKPLTVEGVDFAILDQTNKLQIGEVTPHKTIFLYVYKIDNFKNKGGKIYPEIFIEIPETGFRSTFYGQEIETPSNSLDAITMPLGILGSGTFTVKVTIRDKYARTEKRVQTILTI